MAEASAAIKSTGTIPAPVPPAFREAFSTSPEGRVEESASLRARRLIPLSLLAQGYNPEQIGNILGGFKEYVMEDYLRDLPGTMGAKNHVELLKQALDNGDLNLQDLVRKDLNPSVGLSKIEDPIDRRIVEELARGADYTEMESSLGLKEDEILKRITGIQDKVGAANDLQIVVFALESRRRHLEVAKNKGIENPEIDIFKPLSLTQLQVEILSLYAQGYRDLETHHRLKISKREVKRNLEAIGEQLGVRTTVQAIEKAVELGEIKLGIKEDFDSAFIEDLSPTEIRILEEGIVGGRASIDEIGAWPGMEGIDIKEIIKGIRNKTRAKSTVQAGVLYQLAKREAQRKNLSRLGAA